MDTERALNLLSTGMRCKYVAQELGATYCQVRRVAIANDIPLVRGRPRVVASAKNAAPHVADHHDYLVAVANSGLSISEAAQNVGFSKAAIYVYARKNGIKFTRPSRTDLTPTARAIAWRDMYTAGSTLDEISVGAGVSRERVRQVITKYFGHIRSIGGSSKKASDKRAAAKAKNDERCLAKHGCTYSQYRSLVRLVRKEMKAGIHRDRTPIGAYFRQRQNSKARGVEWKFQLWDWWMVWQKSGKWDRRARNGFVMARFNDEGPYATDNVKIVPSFANIHEGTCKSGLPVGVRHSHRGYEARRKRKLLGVFDTPDAAHLAFLQSLSQ